MKLLILSCLLLVFSSCATWESPKIEKFNGIKKVKVKPRFLSFTLSADVLNPNKKKLTFYESHVDLIIDDKKIGTISNLDEFTLDKNGVTTVSCPFIIETEKGALLNMATYTFKDSVQIQLNGELNLGAGKFKKSYPVEESKTISTKILDLLYKENAIKEFR